MTGIDIKRLRQEGKLDEALKMAKEELEVSPSDEWAKKNLAWVYDSYCKKYAEEGNYQAFIDTVCVLIDLGVNESDQMLIRSMGWRFRSMLSSIERIGDSNGRIQVLDRIFDLARQFYFEKPSETYSVLFKAFLKYKDAWPTFKSFCEWWDFDNFRQEDYVCEVYSSGKKESFCLVERSYIAYAKCLMQENPSELDTIRTFLPKLEALAESHPEMDYPGYFAGKLMLVLNEKGDDIVSTIRPFVRKKKNEFWAWQLLAEAVEKDNRDLYLACLLRAIKCRTKDEFLVRIRLKLVEELVNRKVYDLAAMQLRLYCKTKLSNNSTWQPPGEIRSYLEQAWYKKYQSSQLENIPLDYMALTNNVLFGDMPEQRCIVSFVNSDKQMVTVVYGYEKEGFFKYDSSMRPQIGMELSIRVQDISKDGYMKIFSSRVSSESMRPNLDYFRETEGFVIYNQNKNIYSFKAGDIVCFIPPHFVEKHLLEKGQTRRAQILYSYNKKKEMWMWKLIGIAYEA